MAAHYLLGLQPVSSDLAQKIDDPAMPMKMHKDRVQIFVQNVNVANIYFTNKLSRRDQIECSKPIAFVC